jgi:hypothetical protein
VNLYFIRLLGLVSLFFSEKTSYPLVTENDRHNRQKENNESEVTREIVVISAKKEKPNPEELARLYWVEGLTQIQVAARFRVRRATVAAATKKFEIYFKNRNAQAG